MSAIVCTEDQVNDLSMKLHKLVMKHVNLTFGLDNRTELHASAMMRASELPWRNVPLRLRIAIYKDALAAIVNSGCRIYIEGVDIEQQKARGYSNLTPARELAFAHLLERINECGIESDCMVKVMADEHHSAEVSRSNFSKYQISGTPGYRSSQLKNIEENLLFEQSHKKRLLQAADLVTYIYNRHITITPTDARTAKSGYRQ